jgi:hypothetical protein
MGPPASSAAIPRVPKTTRIMGFVAETTLKAKRSPKKNRSAAGSFSACGRMHFFNLNQISHSPGVFLKFRKIRRIALSMQLVSCVPHFISCGGNWLPNQLKSLSKVKECP